MCSQTVRMERTGRDIVICDNIDIEWQGNSWNDNEQTRSGERPTPQSLLAPSGLTLELCAELSISMSYTPQYNYGAALSRSVTSSTLLPVLLKMALQRLIIPSEAVLL